MPDQSRTCLSSVTSPFTITLITVDRETSSSSVQYTMPSKVETGLNLTIDGLGVLASVAEAVPALGPMVKGSVEALRQILQYAQVRLS
jgi:hypothetical protein